MDAGGLIVEPSWSDDFSPHTELDSIHSLRQFGSSRNIFEGVNIHGNAKAHLGNSYVSHNYFDGGRQLDDLSTLTYHDVHRRIQTQRLVGTGSWFAESDTFAAWRDSPHSASLWCYGSPGAGKTFVASSIVDHLRSNPATQASHVLYLYSSRDREFGQSPSSYLSCLARQLVESVPRGQRRLFLSTIEAHNRGRDCHSIQALLTLFVKMARHFARIYVVLDALDEFSTDPDDRYELLRTLAALQSDDQLPLVLICVTSRETDHGIAPLKLTSAIQIRVPDEELGRYISARITQSSRLSQLCQRSHLTNSIRENVLKASQNV